MSLVPTVLFGCASVASTPPRNISMPQQWRNALPATAQVESVNVRAWWSGLGDPQLLDLVAQADRDNFDVQVASTRLRIAGDAVTAARSLLQPSVEFGATPIDPVIGRVVRSAGGAGDRTNFYELMFGAEYEVDLWGRVRQGVVAARADQVAAVDDAGTVQIAVHSALAAAYFEVRELDEVAPLRSRVTVPVVPAGLPSSLLERRPDVRAAASRVIAAHARTAMADAERFPQLVLTAQLGLISGALHSFLTGAKIIEGVGPGTGYRVLDGGRRNASIDAQRGEADIAVLAYRKAVFAALADVERALIDHASATDALVIAAATSRNQDALLTDARARVAAGRINNDELTAAQAQKLAATVVQVHAYRTRLDNCVALYQALGGGWDARAIAEKAGIAEVAKH